MIVLMYSLTTFPGILKNSKLKSISQTHIRNLLKEICCKFEPKLSLIRVGSSSIFELELASYSKKLIHYSTTVDIDGTWGCPWLAGNLGHGHAAVATAVILGVGLREEEEVDLLRGLLSTQFQSRLRLKISGG